MVLSSSRVVSWDACKQKIYSDDSCPSQFQSLAEDLQLAGVDGQMDGKSCSTGEAGFACVLYIYMYVWLRP